MIATGVEQVTTTMGTGNLTLSATLSPGRLTVNSVFSNDTSNAGIYFQYHVTQKNNSEWESGIGHLSATNIMVRDWVETNNSGGTGFVNFSVGTKVVRASPIGQGISPCQSTVQSTIDSGAKLIGTARPYCLQSRSSVTPDDIIYVPHYHEYMGRVDAVSVITTTGAVVGNCIGGIYVWSPITGLPGRKLVTGAQVPVGDIFTHSNFAARLLPPGYYFIAYSMDAAGSARLFEALTPATGNSVGPLGVGPAGESLLALVENRVYAATLPAVATPKRAVGTGVDIAPKSYLRAA